jgi:branched-chain amino acid transport system substrate-binding protein
MLLTGLLLAARCATPVMPPLPATPAGPTLPLALLGPTTGELAAFGRGAQNGVFLAIDEWNARGGVSRHFLTWRTYDTGCDFEQAQAAARQALAEGAQFIIGPLCSEAAVGAASVAQSAKALLMSPTASHPRLTLDAQNRVRATVFRGSYGLAWQGQATARFVLEALHQDRAALLYQASDTYGLALAEAFAGQFQAGGGQILSTTPFDSGAPDFTPLLAAAAGSGAQVLYLPGDVETANRLGRRLQELGLASSLAVVGSDAWASSELDRAALAGAYLPVHYLQNPARPAAQAWAERYQAAYAVEPTDLAALSYQAANLLFEAAHQAGSLEPAAVATSLASAQFQTLAGPLSFDAQHNPLLPISFVQVNHEQLSYIATVNPSRNGK